MTLTDLQYLVAVAEEGSFRRAADRCHVSQPTLSGQIRKLEDTLEVMLFERRPRGIRPTSFGERVIVAARRILTEANTIVALARQQKAISVGSLRLGIIPTLGPYMIPWLVPALLGNNPQARLSIHEDSANSLMTRLKAFDVDALIVSLPIDDPHLAHTPLFEEPLVVACHRDSSLAARSRVDEQDFAGAPLILLNEGDCLREQALAVCGKRARAGDRPHEDHGAASLETLLRMVACGLGYALVPALAAHTMAGGDPIVIRPCRSSIARRHIGLTWRRTSPLEPEMMRLAQLIRAHLPTPVRPAPSHSDPH